MLRTYPKHITNGLVSSEKSCDQNRYIEWHFLLLFGSIRVWKLTRSYSASMPIMEIRPADERFAVCFVGFAADGDGLYQSGCNVRTGLDLHRIWKVWRRLRGKVNDSSIRKFISLLWHVSTMSVSMVNNGIVRLRLNGLFTLFLYQLSTLLGFLLSKADGTIRVKNP